MKTLIDSTEIPNLEKAEFKLWEEKLSTYEKAKEFCEMHSNGRETIIVPVAVIQYDVYFKDKGNKQ